MSKGFLYNIFCSGGINKDDPFNPKDNKENGMMAFFRDVIGNWLCKPYAKAIVLLIFLGYLSVASWGVTQLKEGLEKKRLSRFDSYSVDFYDVEDKYFREYPFRINVSFTFLTLILLCIKVSMSVIMNYIIGSLYQRKLPPHSPLD